jgi:hypothetical protein
MRWVLLIFVVISVVVGAVFGLGSALMTHPETGSPLTWRESRDCILFGTFVGVALFVILALGACLVSFIWGAI